MEDLSIAIEHDENISSVDLTTMISTNKFNKKAVVALLLVLQGLPLLVVVQGWNHHPPNLFPTMHQFQKYGRSSRTSLTSSSESISEQLQSQSSLDTSVTSKLSNGALFPIEYSKTVSLPPYPILSSLKEGEGAMSDEFIIEIPCVDGSFQKHKFLVMCYPKGGGHGINSRQSLPVFDSLDDLFMSDSQREKMRNVGVYLKYIPHSDDSCLDVTFSLKLKGKQSDGMRRFDLAWESGMRFVSSQNGNLNFGLANDFGASIMQQQLLPSFLGVRNERSSDGILEVQVNLVVHKLSSFQELQESGKVSNVDLIPKDIRLPASKSDLNDVPNSHDAERVRVGKVIVPVLKSISQRRRMFALGCYPGVEYRIMRIFDSNDREIFGSEPGADYEIRPIYPLVQQLEREWPVRVSEKELPLILTPSMYNFVSAVGSLFTAVTGLATAFAISLVISFYFIPSKSMEPNLKVGDVLLVEKVSSKLTKGALLREGDVVLFPPPARLQEIIASNGGKTIDDRDLFVKRIAATTGDVVRVESSGHVDINGVDSPGNRNLCDTEPLRLIEKYIQPRDLEVTEQEIFAMGDCSDVSIDSRVWGPLEKQKIVGRPLLRVWPLERFGAIPPLPPN